MSYLQALFAFFHVLHSNYFMKSKKHSSLSLTLAVNLLFLKNNSYSSKEDQPIAFPTALFE
ncbi:hypothetical protein D922_00186 [Enterococcus faecalis 06-MB-DW-09]|nr:hypothetical protein D931_00091 [Enterococcus faecium 13.SD.W.09]EPH97610.1 hypothetical protein D922_00186 [Enterococcus faecalis 06-MB-DW-09]